MNWLPALPSLLFAQSGSVHLDWEPVAVSLLFGLVGIVLALLGFKMFDWITPGIHVEKELSEKHNVAVAIVCSSVILGVCHIVARVVGAP